MASPELEHVARIISWIFGWIYFCAWTISFFPQTILNIQRRTTHGLTPDFPLLNIFGFGCYSLSTALFLYSTKIREQYAARHPVSPEPTVRLNDLAFGLFGFIMSVVNYSQFWPRLWGWEKRPGVNRHATKITLGLIWGGFIALGVVFVIVLAKGHGNDGKDWAWIDVVYGFEYVKLLYTVFKYIPQVVSNFRRRSTLGWSITQQLLDFTGGILSLAQLVIDSSLQNDWSGVLGNPLKFGLANISLIFDIIFIIQHFFLFGPVEDHDKRQLDNAVYEDAGVTDPLLRR